MTLLAPTEYDQQSGKGERESEDWEVNLVWTIVTFSTDDWTSYRAESSQESLLGKDSAHYVHKTNEY